MTDANSIRVLTEPELLQVLGLSERTFDRMKQRGDVPPKTQLSERRVGCQRPRGRPKFIVIPTKTRPGRLMIQAIRK